jgi:hypothetical protein
MSAENITAWRNVAMIPVIVAVLHLLFVLRCREWVKTDLFRRTCQPLKVRWRPFAWWPVWGPAFRVVYTDPAGLVHAAQAGLPAWHRPVVWRDDEVVGVRASRSCG